MPKDENGREIPSRFYAEDGIMRFVDVTSLTDKDRAELKRMKELMGKNNLIRAKTGARKMDPEKIEEVNKYQVQ
jgi:hypothetical protein